MISYFKIYLLFLIPSYVALSIGYFYTYDQHVTKTVNDFKEKYEKTAESYAIQTVELDKSYETIMKTALLGISAEISSERISTVQLKAIATKYNVSHLFLIDKNGRFFKSTNEEPSKISNLYDYSTEYKKLLSAPPGSYLTTPVIIPFPERVPHKFLIVWNGDFFIEVGFRIKEIAKTMETILSQDKNILQADLTIDGSVYSIKSTTEGDPDSGFLTRKVARVENSNFAQSKEENAHEYLLTFHIASNEIDRSVNAIRRTYIINFLLTLSLITFLLLLATRILRNKVRIITNHLFSMAQEGDYNKTLAVLSRNKDLNNLIQAINNLLSSFRTSSLQTIETEKDLVYKNMALQVAHDIRSPLEALKASKEELSLLPEGDRRNISMAIGRIEEIAYNLLKSRKSETASELTQAHLISQLEQILIEKRMQYRNYTDLSIEGEYDNNAFASFTRMNPETFKRIISNLITNSVEASSYKGSVKVLLRTVDGTNIVKVIDNGCGFSDKNKKNLFKTGFTTKQNGNGLGLINAKNEIEAVGGSIQITTDKETIVTLNLPQISTPSNFPTSINLSGITKVIILDDDESIHSVWKKRFSKANLEIEHFYSAASLLHSYTSVPDNALLLSDFELLGEKQSGLDCIKKLEAFNRSILVTARFDETNIQEETEQNGIKLLPKCMALNIPIVESKAKLNTIVLIDDDKMTHFGWMKKGSQAGMQVKAFYSVQEFLDNCSAIPLDTRIYIDSNLGDELKGEIESEKIAILGFQNLYLATGYDKASIIKPAWIKEIYSKNPEHVFQ